MATVFGNAGQSAGAEALKRFGVVMVAWVILTTAAVAGILGAIQKGYTPVLWTAMFVVWAGSLYLYRRTLRRVFLIAREARHWTRGAEGELRVHKVLAELPIEYAVFHDFHPVTTSGETATWNVDHIVIGPSGVFVIDAKNHGKTVVPPATPGSFEEEAVRRVRSYALDLKANLRRWSSGKLDSLFVVPILVYAQDGAYVEQKREQDVRVIPLKWLLSEITTHAEEHIDIEVAGRIVSVLFNQLSLDLRTTFQPEMNSYGKLSKQARNDKRDAAIAARSAAAATGVERPTVCPQCGGKLVERTAKNGKWAGRRFLGCEKWRPVGGCRYRFDLSDDAA